MMNRITLPSGLVLDMSHLYGPDALITEREVEEFAPVYQKAHSVMMELRQKGTVAPQGEVKISSFLCIII